MADIRSLVSVPSVIIVSAMLPLEFAGLLIVLAALALTTFERKSSSRAFTYRAQIRTQPDDHVPLAHLVA